MRILHVSNYFRDTHSHVGGAEQACYRIAVLSKERGWSASAVTTRPDVNGKSECEVNSLSILEDYLPGRLTPYVEAAKWYALQYDPLAYRAFRQRLQQDSTDIVHFHNCQFLTLSLITAAKKSGLKTVVSIYDYWLFCPTVMLVAPDKDFCARAHGPWCLDCLPQTFRTFQRLLLAVRRRVIDHYLDMVDGFHCLSQHSRAVLEGYGIPAERIHVVPLTLPLEYRRNPAEDHASDPNLILFAGWLNERKGLHRLLEAMPYVLEQCPRARLVAIGGSVRFGEEYEKRLHEIIDTQQLRNHVTFTGHLHPSEVKEYIEKASVVVIPEQYENMSPLLMIESMSMAKPVVISRVGGVPEYIEHGVNGWMADPVDSLDFARNIVTVLIDPSRAETAGRRARETIVDKCGDDRVWEKTRRMYESL